MSAQPVTMRGLNFVDYRRLELQQVPVPALIQPTDVLVRVRAAGICGSDLHGYTGQSGRRKPPLIMGHEAAGEIAAVGKAVDTVTVGDRVTIQPLLYLSDPKTGYRVRKLIGMHLPGAYADYVVVPVHNVYPLPDTLPFTTAALTEPTAVAVHAVSTTHVHPYDTALVVGAGTIGLLTMQALLLAGVEKVVMSDVSEARLSVAKATGAAATINPNTQEFARFVEQQTGGQGFDVTFEAVGVAPAVAQSLQAVRDGGTVVWIGNNQRMVEIDMQSVVTRELKVFGTYGMTERDFRRALQMLGDERIAVEPIISRRASLDEGPILFDELLQAESVVKCVFEM